MRQRPVVVGLTEAGETVYEIRSLRVILPAGAAHFHRLASCARCGRELTGPALVTAADLDHPANPMFCNQCARAPRPERQPPKVPQSPPAETAAPQTADVVPPPEPAAPALDQKLQVLETRLGQVTVRLAGLPAIEEQVRLASQHIEEVAQEQRRELGTLAASLDGVRAHGERMAEWNQQLAHAHEELKERTAALADQDVTQPPLDVGATVAAAVDAERERSQAALADGLARMEQRIAELSERIAALADQDVTRPVPVGMAAMVDAERERTQEAIAEVIARWEHRLDEVSERISGLAAQVVPPPPGQVDATVAAIAGAERERAEAALAAGLASLEHRIEAHASASRDLIDGLRADFDQALRVTVQQVLEATTGPLRQLAEAGDEVKAALLSLQRGAKEGERRVRALEERHDASVRRLTALVASRPAESSEAVRPGPHQGEEVGAHFAGGLLDALDRQLSAAEGRLARHLQASQ
ncbi:MAG TPA: hypothetical protein VMZ73_04265 [Acidimicrobiales bacterium]|nr:hypothetical protein [Acidimicrobiales bacterium]